MSLSGSRLDVDVDQCYLGMGVGFQEGASSIYNGSAIVAQAMERVGTNSLEGRFPLINTP